MSDIHKAMREIYDSAMAIMPPSHRSVLWALHSYRTFSDIVENAALWRDFRSNPITSGLGGPHFWDDTFQKEVLSRLAEPEYRQQQIRTFEDLCRICGEEFVVDLLEPNCGNPPAYDYRGRRVTLRPDLGHIYNAWTLVSTLGHWRKNPVVFAEIGGGYGGLAAKLARLYPNGKYVIFDLPESLTIQFYYLSHMFPDAGIFHYRDYREHGLEGFFAGKWRFAVLPGSLFGKLPPDSVDIAINTRSMMEMTPEVIKEYFDGIHGAVKPNGVFYCANRRHKSDVGVVLRIKDYPFDDRWYFSVSRTLWAQPNVHELLAVRTLLPNAFPAATVLKSLPPHAPGEVVREGLTLFAKIRTIIVGSGAGSGNPGLFRILRGLGEDPRDPLWRLRKWVAKKRNPDFQPKFGDIPR